VFRRNRYTFNAEKRHPFGRIGGSWLTAFAAPISVLFFILPSAQSQSDPVRFYVNRNLVLRYIGDHPGSVRLKKVHLQDVKGTCDIAIRITKVTWRRGSIRFWLKDVGVPQIPGTPRGRCSGHSPEELEVSGFSYDEALEPLTIAIAAVLQTPE
jgi:hypothetical protein